MNEIRLLVSGGNDRSRFFNVKCGESILVGRGERSDTQLNDPSLSRVHFRVALSKGEVFINDEGSSTGTFLNGNRIDRAIANVGDVIQAGDTIFSLTEISNESENTMSPSAPRANIGNLIGKEIGGFKVESTLHVGKSSIVFLANDVKESRKVALKVMLPQIMRDEQQKERFVRAMKTMLSLKHLHIVELYAAGKSGGLCFAAMEYVEAKTL